MIKNFIFGNFIAGRIAKLFSGIKSYKSQIGLITIAILVGVKYLAPIPAEYLPFIDKIIAIVSGATGVSLGDKFRRNYDMAKSALDETLNKIPVEPPKP